MPEGPRVIAVGLLTQRDLDVLGQQFNRFFPIGEAHCFGELLQAIDEAERQFASSPNAVPHTDPMASYGGTRTFRPWNTRHERS